MDLKLKIVEGKNAGHEIRILGKKFFVGRAEDCHLRPGSDLISRHHCVLLVEESYVAVRDFGSKNGTFVNAERVVGERELKHGDRLAFGPLSFEVQLTHGLAAKKRPPVHDVKEAVARTVQDAAQDPMDVAQWLSGEASDDTHVGASRDTQSVSDTDALSMSATQTVTPDQPPTDESKTPAPHGKRQPGKLPPINNASKDSQEAASAMLRNLRKRR